MAHIQLAVCAETQFSKSQQQQELCSVHPRTIPQAFHSLGIWDWQSRHPWLQDSLAQGVPVDRGIPIGLHGDDAGVHPRRLSRPGACNVITHGTGEGWVGVGGYGSEGQPKEVWRVQTISGNGG